MATKTVKVKASKRGGKTVKAHTRKIKITLNVHPMDGSVYATWVGRKKPVYKEDKESLAQFKKRLKGRKEAHVEGKKAKEVIFREEY